MVALPVPETRSVVLATVPLVKALVWIVTPLEDVGTMSLMNRLRDADSVVEGTAKEVEAGTSMGELMTATEVDIRTGPTSMDMKVAARTWEAEKSARSARDLKGAILRF